MKLTETTISKAKTLTIFWSRLAGYLAFSTIIPIATFAVKFGLFKEDATRVDELGNVIDAASISLNGWGIISCIIVAITASGIIKEIIAAYPTYSLTKQCFTGILKNIIPLITAYLICYFLNGVIGHIMYCLSIIIICQSIAIPLNPLPKWRYEKAGVEDYNTLISSLTKLVKKEFGRKE